MMCICDMGNVSSKTCAKNIHCKKKPIEMGLISDKEGYGIVIFEVGTTIGVFDAKYCPICGKKLEVG